MRITAEPPTDAGVYPFAHPVRARFAETDAMGIVHHASYLLYLEEARVAYLRELGRSYAALHADGVNFSVVEAWVSYRRPVRFDEVVDVGVTVLAASRAAFQVGYHLAVDGELRATAVTVHGCVDDDGRPRRLPSWLVAT